MQPPLTPTTLTSPPPPNPVPSQPPRSTLSPTHTLTATNVGVLAPPSPPPLQPQPRFGPTAAWKRTKGKASDSIQGSGAASVAGQPSVCKARKPSQLDSINDFLCCFLAHWRDRNKMVGWGSLLGEGVGTGWKWRDLGTRSAPCPCDLVGVHVVEACLRLLKKYKKLSGGKKREREKNKNKNELDKREGIKLIWKCCRITIYNVNLLVVISDNSGGADVIIRVRSHFCCWCSLHVLENPCGCWGRQADANTEVTTNAAQFRNSRWGNKEKAMLFIVT